MLSRRRFITICAGTLASGLVTLKGLQANPGNPKLATVRWRGTAMGAEAELILSHPSPARAQKAMVLVEQEVRRLEKVFSLFDPASALSQLNQRGVLDAPPLDLVRCLDDALQIGAITDGAFDVTVQPLWDLYSRHFAANPTDLIGPDRGDIAAALKRVDYRTVDVDSQKIVLGKPGQQVTLNGIAQGYVTDRVAEMLKSEGFDNVLIDLGEVRALGQRERGTNWSVGIKSADPSGPLLRKLALRNASIATSGGYGTRFTVKGGFHHLFDPRTGGNRQGWRSISVIANRATQADGLSTGFYSLSAQRIDTLATRLKVSVIASGADGEQTLGVSPDRFVS